MNFINDKELAKRFKEGTVPARKRLYYFIIFIVVVTLIISSFASSFLNASINKFDITADILDLIVTIIGTIFLYRTNADGDNREFIERYVCIGFQVTVQVVILILFVILTIELTTQDGLPEETSVYDLMISVVSYVYFYFRLYQSIKIASH